MAQSPVNSRKFALGDGQHTTERQAISAFVRNPQQSGMGEGPIKLSCFGIQGTKWKCTIIDPRYRDNFGVISSREYLIRFFEIIITQGFLHYGYARGSQQSDHTLPRDACQEGSICSRRENNAVLGHENVGCGQLRDVSQDVADDRIVEASSVYFEKCARVAGI